MITTQRLRLRPWQASDLEPLAALNADPEVMKYFPDTLDYTESEAMFERVQQHFAEHGFGFWAVEVIQDDGRSIPFIGAVGFSIPRFEAHFTPCVEIGWRLAKAYWGKGYATEAAQAALEYGFNVLQLDQIVSFTVPDNQASRAVMRRLGMTRNPADDFEHPAVPEKHLLRPHVLYRLFKSDFLKR